jgi:hypothetical protein
MLHRRNYMRADRLLVSRAARMLIATLLMAAAVWITRTILVAAPAHHVAVVVLAVLIAVGLVAYGALAQAFGVLDSVGMGKKIIARLRRK